jgi:hypothetical protein
MLPHYLSTEAELENEKDGAEEGHELDYGDAKWIIKRHEACTWFKSK